MLITSSRPAPRFGGTNHGVFHPTTVIYVVCSDIKPLFDVLRNSRCLDFVVTITMSDERAAAFALARMRFWARRRSRPVYS